jgi:hypothetical protein
MGFKGNVNRYGFIALAYVGLGCGYIVFGNSISEYYPSGLRGVLQAFGTIHLVSLFLCYYNRKYIFGVKEITSTDTSWTETITYYGGYV